jgi:hypothetical protein
MVMDPFQTLKKGTSQRRAVLQRDWVMQMITIVYPNHTQIHKPGLQQKAGKQKRKNEIDIQGKYEVRGPDHSQNKGLWAFAFQGLYGNRFV